MSVTRHTIGTTYLLAKVVPVYNVLGHVVDGVFEIEPITVTEDWAIDAILEANLVDFIAPGQLLSIGRQRVKPFPISSARSALVIASTETKET